MDKLPVVDLAILIGYLLATVGLGCSFALRKRSSDQFMAGGRSLPGWAVGLSMFGSYVSSISFLANPGKSFASNWNPFVFSLATPLAAVVAVWWFVPFYRRLGNISAYEHLERRFGAWARSYAVACFLLTQTARMGTVVYLLSLAVSPLTGWDIHTLIVLTGSLMIVCTIFGGMESIVWIGMVQSLVLIAGPLICLTVLLLQVPGGFAGVVQTGVAHDKFSLGSYSASLAQPTFWVVLAYGLAINLGNFGIDQSYVQRYIATRTQKEAQRSVWLTTALYVPAAAFFFLIGTGLFALYAARPELFPGLDVASQPDKVFPYFIAHRLPIGLSGLVVAAIFAASLDSSLGSMATLTLCDFYKRYLRPTAGERESLRVLQGATLFWGVLGTLAAIGMTRVKHALDVWWELAGILSGGMLGLFLLGLLAPRAGRAAGLLGVFAGLLVIVWMTLSPTASWPAALGELRSPLHPFLVPVAGTIAILGVGMLAARLCGRPQDSSQDALRQ